MLLGMPAGELVMLVAALIVAGLIAGFLAGLLGIGGGGVLVPVLYEIFGVLGIDPAIRMHLALGTTLAVILPTALKSFAGHRAKGPSAAPLKWVWAIAAGVVAIKMAFGREDWWISDHLPPRPWPEIAALGIGILSALISIGGATFVVPLLTLYGFAILTAVGTASGIGPMIALPGV